MSEDKEKDIKPKKNKKKRKFHILKIFIITILLLSFIATGVAAGMVIATLRSVEPINPSKIQELLNESSYIYAANGELIEKIQSDYHSELVKFDELPKDLVNAFIAIEDQDFFEHNGISPKRIVKALWEVIKARAPVQGASTITQQVAKNIYLTHDKTLTRKIKEVYYAFQLEKHLTKEQILEIYLTTAYMGGGAKGVIAASKTYFSKELHELDLAEIAVLAGVSKNPSRFSPIKTLKKEDVDLERHHIIDDEDPIYTIIYDERFKERQHLVLRIMRNENMITEEEYQQALSVDILSRINPSKPESISSFMADMVKKDVREALMLTLDMSEEEASHMINNQGLRIYSTLDMEMQRIVENAYLENKNFPNLVMRKDKAGNILNKSRSSILLYKYSNVFNDNNDLIIPKGDFHYDESGNLILSAGNRLVFNPINNDGNLEGINVSFRDIFLQNEGEELKILKGGAIKLSPKSMQFDDKKNLLVDNDYLKENPEIFKTDSNENLLVSNKYISKNFFSQSNRAVQPQSAMVIMDYRTGEIKALIGGRDIIGRRVFNRATNPRPPGSAIKPLSVYIPALDNGWTAADVIDDIPSYDNQGNLWPRNYYNDFWGLSTLREGVQWSMNVMAVKLLERIGISTSIDYLKKMGITTLSESGRSNDQNLAALGLGGMTFGISPLEMTAAYGSIANQGVYIKPVSFTKITDSEGNVILENTSFKNRVTSPEVAYIMTDMMRSAVDSGTAQRAKLDNNNSNIPVSGKTGTTSDNHDAWFVGYTPYYIGGVWIGNDIQIELDSGSAMSAQLWKTVMAQIHKNLPAKDFDRPQDIVSATIDTESGKLATELSQRDPRGSTARNEIFVRGTAPTEFSDIHVELEIDTTSNKIATVYCPPTLVEKRVFIRRPVPYDPAQNQGLVPRDFIYEAPLDLCDIHTSFDYGLPIDDLFPPNPLIPPPTVIDPITGEEIIDSAN